MCECRCYFSLLDIYKDPRYILKSQNINDKKIKMHKYSKNEKMLKNKIKTKQSNKNALGEYGFKKKKKTVK